MQGLVAQVTAMIQEASAVFEGEKTGFFITIGWDMLKHYTAYMASQEISTVFFEEKVVVISGWAVVDSRFRVRSTFIEL